MLQVIGLKAEPITVPLSAAIYPSAFGGDVEFIVSRRETCMGFWESWKVITRSTVEYGHGHENILRDLREHSHANGWILIPSLRSQRSIQEITSKL